MHGNETLDLLMNRKSIRRFSERTPPREVVEAIVRAGQQAPFAAQLGSVVLSERVAEHPFRAPLLFTVLVDVHRLERILAARGWETVTSDAVLLLFGIQDASYMAENMVVAAEALGLGSCFLGGAPFRAAQISERYRLPQRVFPLVQLAMGYPAEKAPPRPRFPLPFSLHDGAYPEDDQQELARAMDAMDEGYLAQDYYQAQRARIPLEGGRPERFTDKDYSWTEHMGRKWGQWLADPEELLGPLRACGFDV